MNSQLTRLLAALAACLVILTGIISFKNRMGAPTDEGPKKRPTGVIATQQSKPKPKPEAGDASCTIKRAIFGGERAALIKVPKRSVQHYIVLDLPADNPMMPFYQADWLAANYGKVTPQFMGEFATVDAAVRKAANLCKRN
jgi:hypothetical protein